MALRAECTCRWQSQRREMWNIADVTSGGATVVLVPQELDINRWRHRTQLPRCRTPRTSRRAQKRPTHEV
jgi:hypothetical protein